MSSRGWSGEGWRRVRKDFRDRETLRMGRGGRDIVYRDVEMVT